MTMQQNFSYQCFGPKHLQKPVSQNSFSVIENHLPDTTAATAETRRVEKRIVLDCLGRCQSR